MDIVCIRVRLGTVLERYEMGQDQTTQLGNKLGNRHKTEHRRTGDRTHKDKDRDNPTRHEREGRFAGTSRDDASWRMGKVKT